LEEAFMTALFPVLIRRTAAEAERRLREGAGLLAAIAAVAREPERTKPSETAFVDAEAREKDGDHLRRLLDHEARLHRLERAMKVQDHDLRTLRTDLDSLVTQLNDRLLPKIDERIDDTERDLTVLASGLVRTGREAATQRTGLEAVENRLADLRGKLTRVEQRASLWRDLQASIARIGDELDALRTRHLPTQGSQVPQTPQVS
jgi:chromosome segregation ATPase